MSKIKVNEEDLKQFASIIGKVEDKCGEAIRHLNVDLTSMLSNIPGVSTRRIQDIEATYKQVIHKYREKLDHAQQLVKKTEAAMKQAEKNLAMKAGEFGLEMLGYYDAQRIFSEYDPITGEKVSVGDRLLATGMLALSLFPPAKVVGVGGKVAIKGANAGTKFGFASFAKNLPTFNSMKNVLNTNKVIEVFKGIYKEVVKAPLAATKLWLDRTVRQIADFRLPDIGQQVVTAIGAIASKTVEEAFGEAKDFFLKMASGEADNRSVWMENKGTVKDKHLDDVPRIKEIEVNFNRNGKHDQEEFTRQLRDQEKGMNELTVDEYLKNRERYIAEGRAIEGNAAQQTAREEALSDKIAEFMADGKSFDEAEKEAKVWINTQAALHNPDQIAGGRPDKIGGMGHKGINSSIGSQWRYRIDVVDEQIREMAKNMTPEQIANTYLNVKLIN